ncbi:LptE family protein [Candidatus Symbiothrix dinenymphae]|uniref:LptE family protein n=1 Tax=Candidatus Symbiothrix dinenymphae TaxID=467085 RepID=UPI0006E2BB0A|nr:LptE family protein [Candidatus Symbiothrix dinenymphae]
MKKLIKSCSCILLMLVGIGCSVSYSFQGGKLNYEVVKTITIQDFMNRAALVNPNLAPTFDRALRDRFVEQTRLTAVENNADIDIEGEITGYDLMGTAVKDDAYASQTRLTVSIRVRYTNNKEEGANVDQTFTAFREFPASSNLSDVEDGLVREIVTELVDMIYNATVANW